MIRSIFVFTSCLAATGWLLCQPALAAPGEGDGKRAELRHKVLQKFDRNGNSQLDPDEREAAKEAVQKRRKQGGGKGPARRGGLDPELRRKLLDRFDTDGDGKFNETERAAAKEARVKRGR